MAIPVCVELLEDLIGSHLDCLLLEEARNATTTSSMPSS
jgi:hypothetical protein